MERLVHFFFRTVNRLFWLLVTTVFATAEEASPWIRLITGLLDTRTTPALADLPVKLSDDRTGAFFVQCSGRLKPEWARALREVGLVLCGYIPDNAVIVWGARASVERALTYPFVRWAGPCRPEHKIGLEVGGAGPFFIRPELRRTAADVGDVEWPRQYTLVTYLPADAPVVGARLQARGEPEPLVRQGFRKGYVRAQLSGAARDEVVTWSEVEYVTAYEPPSWMNNVAVGPALTNVTPIWNEHGLTGSNQRL